MEKDKKSQGNKSLPKKLIAFSFFLALFLCAKFLLPKFQQDSNLLQPESPFENSVQTVQTEELQTGESVPQAYLAVAQDESCTQESAEVSLSKGGSYTSKEDVALYIRTYNCLPPNFITKQQAQGVDLRAEGKCIGGDRFYNREGILPKAKGRTYTECDIDTLGKSSRGAKRIVFSNDGLIYYTGDHYQTFVLLYGEEK